jgi:UDP-4-amino-4-deoxy-L-arabinose formyltransferase/UDP-glucuronic acid dehydrogenase (UDP-4-keto-hexauronic acid decarboxylating)
VAPADRAGLAARTVERAVRLKVVLVAEEAAGAQAFRNLTRTEHTVAGLLTSVSSTHGGGSVVGLAMRLGVPVFPSTLVREASTADWLAREQVDVLLNVHSLYVIHPAVVRAPRIGSFNLHPGPLPEYAGLNAPSWAIYNGEPAHGVTLHWMEAEIDTGPIAFAATFPISERDTGLSVSATCVREGLPLVTRLLEVAAEDPGSIPAEPQDLSRRRWFGREVPNDGRVGWSHSARELVDFVRACDYLPFVSPWGHPVARLRDQELALLKASRTYEPAGAEPGAVGHVDDGTACVATADEWVRLHRVRLGGEAVDAGAVLSPGDRLEDG